MRSFLFGLLSWMCFFSPLVVAQELQEPIPSEIYISAVDGSKALHHFILKYGTIEELNALLKVVPKGAKVRVIVPEGAPETEVGALTAGKDLAVEPEVLAVPAPTSEQMDQVEKAFAHEEELAKKDTNAVPRMKAWKGLQLFMSGIRDWVMEQHNFSARLTNKIVKVITSLKVGTGVTLWMWKAAGSPEITTAAVFSLVAALTSYDTYVNLSHGAGNIFTSAPLLAGSAAVASGFFLDWWFQKNATYYTQVIKQGHKIGWEYYDQSPRLKNLTVDILVSTLVGSYFRYLASVTDGKPINPLLHPEYLAQHFGSNIIPWLFSAVGEPSATSLMKKRAIPKIVGTMLFQFWALCFFSREFLKNAGIVSMEKGNLHWLTMAVGVELISKSVVGIVDSFTPDLKPTDQRIVDFFERDLQHKGDVVITIMPPGEVSSYRVSQLNALNGSIAVRSSDKLKKFLGDCGVVFDTAHAH